MLYLENPDGVSAESRRASLDTIGQLNAERAEVVGDPEIDTRIASYELSLSLQTSVPELMDISSEPESVHSLYGTEPGQASFANNCLLARRLVERGVRFVQLYHWGWDHHYARARGRYCHGAPCAFASRPTAHRRRLVKDLKERGSSTKRSSCGAASSVAPP